MPKRSHPQQQPNSDKRQRVYAACAECRRRRRKCDGKMPCSSCDSHGYTCAYGGSSSALSATTTPNGGGSSVTTENSPSQTQAQPNGVTSLPRNSSLPGNIVVSKERCRFVSAHSAVALPHLVGRELKSTNPPRLHSFAWNLGLRQEQRGEIHISLADYISLEECRTLSATYFASIHPFFCFLSEKTYYGRLESHWPSIESIPNFAAIVAGVCALGSFFSDPGHSREELIKRHCFSILDLCLSTPIVMVDMDSVGGWILRTLYTRLTTRPAITTLSSHTTMHMVDVLSLHRDVSENVTIRISERSEFTAEELETRRRHWWVAWYLNNLLCTEYGLAPVKLFHANCPPPSPRPGIHVTSLVALGKVLQNVDEVTKSGLGSQDVQDLVVVLQNIEDEDAVVSLFKADTCLCILRRFISASQRPVPCINTAAVAIFQKALDGISDLLAKKQTWWNMIGIPFNVVCVCVSMDTTDYLTLLPTAVELLRRISDTFESHMAKEALSTAQALVSASRGQTDEKLRFKDNALSHTLQEDNSWLSLDQAFEMGDGWPLGLDFLPFT